MSGRGDSAKNIANSPPPSGSALRSLRVEEQLALLTNHFNSPPRSLRGDPELEKGIADQKRKWPGAMGGPAVPDLVVGVLKEKASSSMD